MARQPQQQQTPGANDGMSLSPGGRAALATREGLGGSPGNAGGYYNDTADNCTYGIGTLAHYGPCRADELSRPADAVRNQADFDARAKAAEAAVRANVNTRHLNQNQYDSLVSGAYNSGRGMASTYASANSGDDVGAVGQMRRNIMIHQHDAHGHAVGPPKVSRGLINRRASEIAQYQHPVAAAPARGRR